MKTRVTIGMEIRGVILGTSLEGGGGGLIGRCTTSILVGLFMFYSWESCELIVPPIYSVVVF